MCVVILSCDDNNTIHRKSSDKYLTRQVVVFDFISCIIAQSLFVMFYIKYLDG